MQIVRSAAGLRGLKSLAATASSARVLDLHGLGAAPPLDPEYKTRPLFVHPLLNRTLIVKHNLRDGEDDGMSARRFNATKVIFPFDAGDLGLGGQYVFAEQHGLPEVLARHLNYAERDLDRDVRVLRALAQLPTLDPFLVREALSRHQLDVARCYYQFSQSDKTEMLGFVTTQLEALIALCFDEADSRHAERMSALLLSDQSDPKLDPLRETLRMSEFEFAEAMFSWKAFLYYRWKSRSMRPTLRATLRAVAAVRGDRRGADAAIYIGRARRLLEETMLEAWRGINERLKLYDRAYESLTEGRSAEGFRDFLQAGPRLLLEVGERIGRLEQVVSFWDFRFGGERTEAFSPEQISDGLRDLLQELSIWPGALSPTAELAAPVARLPELAA
jgi:hypothetical protein